MEGQTFTTNATVSYDGVKIDNIVTSKVDATPVYNTQGTDVKYVKYTFEFEAIVYPTSFILEPEAQTTTDDALEEIRLMLLTPRKAFLYKDKGFGEDFEVRASGTDPNLDLDVMYGPRPIRLTFETIASNKAARINWAVEVHVRRECASGIDQTNLLEFWTTSSVKINQSGYQTLTRKGKIEVLGNAAGETMSTTGLVNSPITDRLVSLGSMQGYHLESTFTPSDDGRVLDFVFVYTEIESPNAYPLGVVDIKCRHSTGSTLMSSNPIQGAQFRSWRNSMNCTIQLRPNVPQLRAWEIFSAIATDRINQGVSVETVNQNGDKVITRTLVPIVLSMKIDEEMFSHSISFSISWVSFTQTISELFSSTGILKPYVNVQETWGDWVVDIRQNTQRRQGAYPLTNDGATTQIINPCTSGATVNSVPDTTRGDILPVIPAIFAPGCPPEESSWLDYKSKCEIQSKSNIKIHRKYKSIDDVVRTDDQIEAFTPSSSVSRQYDTASTEEDHFEQDFGNDIHLGVVTGYAVRLGAPTEPPRVMTIGGRRATLNREKSVVSNTPLSSNNLCSVHITKWKLKYDIHGIPNGDITEEVEASSGSANFQQS